MRWHELLVLFGLRVDLLMAGFAGGVVSVCLMRNATPWAATGSIIAGTLTANYFGEAVSSLANIKLLLAAFVVGLTAMILCRTVTEVVASKIGGWAASKGAGTVSVGVPDNERNRP